MTTFSHNDLGQYWQFLISKVLRHRLKFQVTIPYNEFENHIYSNLPPKPTAVNELTSYVYRQSQVRESTDSWVKWAECSLIIKTGCRVQVFAWFSIAQSFCQRAFSLLAIWCLRPRVQILQSAEEHNLSPFDLNIACLCQSIEINNNKHVYRQSQVRKSTDSEVKWAECSLIIGTDCRVQVFSLILDSSVGLSAGIPTAGE